MKITEVRTKADWKHFHKVVKLVYKEDASWIPHIEKDIEAVFDPAKNVRYQNGASKVWVAINDKGVPVGRIAAFIDHEANKSLPIKTGGLGFFEAIRDKELAKALFDTAKAYLSSFDIQAIDGPICFGERDKFYGLQTYGYEHKLFQENYNPSYYIDFFNEYGFERYQQILTFRFISREIPVEKFRRIGKRVMERNPIQLSYANPSNYMKTAEDICVVYNEAFSDYEHYKPVGPDVIYKMIQDAKLILDPKLVSIGYMNNEPAAVVAALPNIAPFTKALNGKLDMWRIPIFLYHKWKAHRPDVKGILSGVRPKYQNKGVYACVLTNIMTEYHINKYNSGYMPSIAGNNDVMINTFTKFGAVVVREHIVHRLLLDPSIDLNPFKFKEFERN